MTDFIIVAIIACIIGLAAGYIYNEKKKGRECIGCPHSGSCGGSCGGNCSGCGHSCGYGGHRE